MFVCAHLQGQRWTLTYESTGNRPDIALLCRLQLKYWVRASVIIPWACYKQNAFSNLLWFFSFSHIEKKADSPFWGPAHFRTIIVPCFPAVSSVLSTIKILLSPRLGPNERKWGPCLLIFSMMMLSLVEHGGCCSLKALEGWVKQASELWWAASRQAKAAKRCLFCRCC